MDNLKFKKLSLEDKPIIDKFFNDFPPDASEYTFTNLFVWRNSREIEYCLYNEGLILLARKKNEKFFMQPFGYLDNKKIIEFILNYGIKFNLANSIKKISENIISSIEGFNIIEDRDNFDYLYKTDDLAFLKGRKYSNKRNFIRNFFADYYHKYWRYTEKCKEVCLNFAKAWLEKREGQDDSLVDEFNAIKELLNNFKNLDSAGGVICVEEKIIAFEFGEKLNKDTFVVHFEKADSSINGSYQSINKLFVENEIEGQYKFVNREQDLGIPGIRKAKESYYPVKMVKKFSIIG